MVFHGFSKAFHGFAWFCMAFSIRFESSEAFWHRIYFISAREPLASVSGTSGMLRWGMAA